MKKYFVNVHYDASISVEVVADNEKQALELAISKAEEMPLTDADIVGANPCVTDTIDLDGIMERNGHDESLVNCINDAWNSRHKYPSMEEIIDLLQHRDEKLFYGEFGTKSGYYEYLTNVADDADLRCILNYIHFFDKKD